MLKYVTLLAILSGLIAPVAVSAAVPATHLEYAFTAYPAVGSGGGQGTLSVDLLGAAPDGGLLVRVHDVWTHPWRELRPRAAVTCDISAGGNVNCPDAPYVLSPVQRALLPFLAPAFFQDRASWTQAYRVRAYPSVRVSVSRAIERAGPAPSGVRLTFNGRTTVHAAGHVTFGNTTGSLVYDPSTHLPLEIDAQTSRTPANNAFERLDVTLRLQSSS